MRRYDRMDALVWAVHELTQEVDQLSNLAPERHTYDGPKKSSGETLLSVEEMIKEQTLQVDADLCHWPQLRTAMNEFLGRMMQSGEIGVGTLLQREIERGDALLGHSYELIPDQVDVVDDPSSVPS